VEASSRNKFSSAWALDSLGRLAEQDRALFEEVVPMLQTAYETGPASARVRARERLKALGIL
jgi:lipopolysaccharide biosynthesis regulator YciM